MMGPVRPATILHADLDAFYAAVEQLENPSLRGVPMAVGEGVILAASYEARAFGVRSAMPTARARSLCPSLRVVPGSFTRYLHYSRQVMDLLSGFTPHLEQISVDEAFLDVAGTVHLFGPPPLIATEIRRRVREEIGLPMSVGVASTKFLAKVASQVAKPDGLVVVPAGEELAFLHPLGVEMLWGVGPATARKLAQGGIETVGDLAATPVESLATWLGRAAAVHLYALAHNRDRRPVAAPTKATSISSQQALGAGTSDVAELDRVLLSLAERVGRRLRAKDQRARTVTVRLRFPGGRAITRSETVARPLSATEAIAEVGRRLLRHGLVDEPKERVTLVGISVSGLSEEADRQEVLAFDEEMSRHDAVDRQVDEIRRRFGEQAVTRAGLLGRVDADAPEEFRRLAERD